MTLQKAHGMDMLCGWMGIKDNQVLNPLVEPI